MPPTKIPHLSKEQWNLMRHMSAKGPLTTSTLSNLEPSFSEKKVVVNLEYLRHPEGLLTRARSGKWALSAEGARVFKAYQEFLDPATLAIRLIKISEAATTLADSGLNRRAIVVLLHDSTKISKRSIVSVLDGLELLAENYCKQP